MRARRVVLLATAILSLAAAREARAEQTPGLVVDAASGRVLFADRATEPWYPASITKLMTAYVALDMVRSARVSMDTLMTMSEEAASQPPSKLGLKPGGTITLENALKIIMVKSANDLAYMVGENLGGSVEGFANMMNDRSHRLGMSESRWYNPNGLPDPRQQTSARDMAIIGAVKLGAQVMRNHNGMLGRYPGADGMKTGFICSGGFNIVASATQNGRRLITVVMGYPSARERDLRAADLFDVGFASRGWGSQNVESLPPSGVMSPTDMRPFVCGAKRRVPQEDDETALLRASTANDNPIASLFSATALGSFAGSAPQLGGRKTLGPRVAFEPIPVWLGASPGAVPDEPGASGRGRRVRIASRPVRTKPAELASGVRPTQTFTSVTPAEASAEGAPRIETLKTGKRPAGRAALQANLGSKPVAETKVKVGATAGEASGLNPDGKGSKSKKTADAKLKAGKAQDPKTRSAAAPERKKPAGAAAKSSSAKAE